MHTRCKYMQRDAKNFCIDDQEIVSVYETLGSDVTPDLKARTPPFSSKMSREISFSCLLTNSQPPHGLFRKPKEPSHTCVCARPCKATEDPKTRSGKRTANKYSHCRQNLHMLIVDKHIHTYVGMYKTDGYTIFVT